MAPEEPKLLKSTDPASVEQLASSGAPTPAPMDPKQKYFFFPFCLILCIFFTKGTNCRCNVTNNLEKSCIFGPLEVLLMFAGTPPKLLR